MNYKYDKQYQTLQQFDLDGTLKASMQMPQSDIKKISKILQPIDVRVTSIEEVRQEFIDNFKENILRNVDFALKSDV